MLIFFVMIFSAVYFSAVAPAGHRSTAWHHPSSPSLPLSAKSRHEWIDILKFSVVGHSGVMSSHWRCQFKASVQFQFCMFGCFQFHRVMQILWQAALMGIWCSFKHDVQRSQPAMHCYGVWEVPFIMQKSLIEGCIFLNGVSFFMVAHCT